MTETDKANALDWLNDIVTNPDEWHMFYSDSETKICAETVISMLKEKDESIQSLLNEKLNNLNKQSAILTHELRMTNLLQLSHSL